MKRWIPVGSRRHRRQLAAALIAVSLCAARSAAAEGTKPAFDYEGMNGDVTIKQAKSRVQTVLRCARDEDVPALVRCDEDASTYFGKRAVLKLEFIDDKLAQLTVRVQSDDFEAVSRGVLERFGTPRRRGLETDGPMPYAHMEWTLADGELIVDERVARFIPAWQRYDYVTEVIFYPASMAKRRAEVQWSAVRAIHDRHIADN
ncbi:MAG TPA: hypothetical protein VFB20_14885 [Burkholderiales bacterium]|nr:hypothetical protein [Burkholderiales bacterium]